MDANAITRALWRALRSRRTAFAVLTFLAAYTALFGWTEFHAFPHPFSSPLFIGACTVLFLSTFVCVCDRTRSVARLWQGPDGSCGIRVPRRRGTDFPSFLHSAGFVQRGERWFRWRIAFWSGWILHVGILAVIGGVVVQRAFHDSGAFELAEGEAATLSDPAIVFGRDAGPLTGNDPPNVRIGLLAFDPYLRQDGYAPDRGSTIAIGERTLFLDRADGATAGGLTIFQAIPTGLSLNVDIEGADPRAIHLRPLDARTATAEIVDPAGNILRFTLRGERPLDDPVATGELRITVDRGIDRTHVNGDIPFAFGFGRARIASVGRWGGFTYSRSPGMPLVFAGFVIILAGCVLLVFPAAVAGTVADEEFAGWIYSSRGAEALLADWNDWRGAAAGSQAGVLPLHAGVEVT